MIIFQPVNWIESKFSVSFARIKLGVIKRISSLFFFSLWLLRIESDKSTTISLISFHNDYNYNFFLECFLHDKSFSGAQNELPACFWAPHMTKGCTSMFSNGDNEGEVSVRPHCPSRELKLPGFSISSYTICL